MRCEVLSEVNMRAKPQKICSIMVMVPQIYYNVDFKVDTPRPTNAFEQGVLDVCALIPAIPEERTLFELFEQELGLPRAKAFLLPILRTMESEGLLERKVKSMSWGEVTLVDLVLTEVGVHSQRNQRFPKEPVDKNWILKRNIITGKVSNANMVPNNEMDQEQEIVMQIPKSEDHSFQEIWLLEKIMASKGQLDWYKNETQILQIRPSTQVVYQKEEIPLFLHQNGSIAPEQKYQTLWTNCDPDIMLSKLQTTPILQTQNILQYQKIQEEVEEITSNHLAKNPSFHQKIHGRFIREDLFLQVEWKEPTKWLLVYGSSHDSIVWSEGNKGITIHTTQTLENSIVYGDSGILWSYVGIQGDFSGTTVDIYSFVKRKERKSILEIVQILGLETLLKTDWLAFGCFCSTEEELQNWFLSQPWSFIEKLEKVDTIQKTRLSMKIASLSLSKIKKLLVQEALLQQVFDWENVTLLKSKKLLDLDDIKNIAKEAVDQRAPIPSSLEELVVLKRDYKMLFGSKMHLPPRFSESLKTEICQEIGSESFAIELLNLQPNEQTIVQQFHENLKKWHNTQDPILQQKLDLFYSWQKVSELGEDSIVWKICQQKSQLSFGDSAQFEQLLSLEDFPEDNRYSKFVIFDTSALVNLPKLLERSISKPGHRVILPRIIFGELNGLKSAQFDEKNRNLTKEDFEVRQKNVRDLNHFLGKTPEEKTKIIVQDSDLKLLNAERRTNQPDDLILATVLRFIALQDHVYFISDDKNLRGRVKFEGFRTFSSDEFKTYLNNSTKIRKKNK